MDDKLVADPVESRIRQHLAGVLEAAGVNDDFIRKTVRRVDEALDAHRTTRIKMRDSEGKDVIETFNDIDHGRRLGAVDRALDLAARANKIPAGADGRRGGDSRPQINVKITVLSRGGEKKLLEITSNSPESGAVT